MQYLTQHLFIILLLFAALPQAAVAQGTWQQIEDKEGGFIISFPGESVYEQSSDPSLIHQTEKYKFFYNGRLLQIVFAHLNKQLRTPTEFSDAFAEITRVQAKDGLLLQQVKLPDGGRQYDNVTRDEDGIAYHRTRVYIRNGKYYSISYSMYAASGLDEREAARFFSSFRFISSAPKKQVSARRDASSKVAINNTQRGDWYSFLAPKRKFGVNFPGKPNYREFPNYDTGIPDCKYYFQYGENTFIVSFREEPTASSRPEAVIRRVLEKELRDNDVWHVTQHIRLRDGGYYIESQGVIDGMPVNMRTKIYLRGTSLYHITTMTQNLTGPNKTDLDKFFRSFHFL